MENLESYQHSSYLEYTEEKDLTDTEFLMGMIDKKEFTEYHREVEELEFRVTDIKKKTDGDVLLFLKKHYKMVNAKSISKLPKVERDRILTELKMKFPVRQIQRITGVSRGVITKAK